MTPAAAAILEGMPDPRPLRRADRDGITFILAGSAVLASYPSADAGMRNVAVAMCRQLGFSGRAVAPVMGLTENYVATLHNRALREGVARAGARSGTAPQAGRRAYLGERGPVAGRWRFRQRDRPPAGGSPSPRCSAAWARPPCRSSCPPRAGRRRARARGRSRGAGAWRSRGAGAGAVRPSSRGEPARPREPGPARPPSRPRCPLELAGGPAGRRAGSRTAGGAPPSRYAGAMLAHAYLDRIGAEAILAAALPPALARPRYDDLALLTATSLAFALGRRLDRADQAPGRGRGRAAGRAGGAAGPADPAAPAGRDRRRRGPAGGAAAVRVRDAGRRPGDVRGVLRR